MASFDKYAKKIRTKVEEEMARTFDARVEAKVKELVEGTKQEIEKKYKEKLKKAKKKVEEARNGEFLAWSFVKDR